MVAMVLMGVRSLKEEILLVHYIIDGILTEVPTNMLYEQSDEDERRSIHYEVNFGNQHLISCSADDTEFAVKNLKRVLPTNIMIACCQSCRHGNFNPYGDYDNEIFCLKDMTYNNKMEVCEIFSEKYDLLKARRRKLLDFCSDFMPLFDEEYYTYNDWEYY